MNFIDTPQGRCGIEVEGNQCGENTVLLVAPLMRWVCARHVTLAFTGAESTDFAKEGKPYVFKGDTNMGTREREDGQLDRTDCDPEHCHTDEDGSETHGGSCPIFHQSLQEDFVVGEPDEQGRCLLTPIDLDQIKPLDPEV
jgi:hypothetical protein